MADTRRTITECNTLLADNTTGEISPQDVRDCLVQTALLTSTRANTGTTDTALEVDHGKTVTDSNATGVTVTLPSTIPTGWFCIRKNDGVGDSVLTPDGGLLIDGAATLTLHTGDWCRVTKEASAWVISGTANKSTGWRKYTVAYSNAAFKAASTTAAITLFTLPANGVIQGLRIKQSVAFAGTGVTAVTCSLGDGTTADAYSPAVNVFAAASNTAQWFDGGSYSTTAAAHTIVLTFTGNTNFGDGSATVLTAGSVDVHVWWSILP